MHVRSGSKTGLKNRSATYGNQPFSATTQNTFSSQETYQENVVGQDGRIAATYKPGRKSNSNRASCFYCGGPVHVLSTCPARDVTCHWCKRRGHFEKVCRMKIHKRGILNTTAPTKRQGHVSAVIDAPVLSPVIAGSPECLKEAVVTGELHGRKVQVVFDSAASHSYIDAGVPRQIGLKIIGVPSNIVHACTKASANTRGCVITNLNMLGQTCTLKASIMSCLCSDVLLGHDILCQHCTVIFKMGGSGPALTIQLLGQTDAVPEKSAASTLHDIRRYCCVSIVNVEPPRFFGFLDKNSRPIVTTSRHYSQDNMIFIQNEVGKLLEAGIIEPSSSPWRTHVLVTKDERHKTFGYRLFENY